MSGAGTGVTVVKVGGAPNLLLRVLWFLIVGWWLGQLVLLLAWVLNITVIGLPLGLALLNGLPGIFTLHSSTQTTVSVGGQVVSTTRPPNWFVRASYFVIVGWWFSLIWLETAWLLCVTVIGLPLGFWMFGRAGKVTTLAAS